MKDGLDWENEFVGAEDFDQSRWDIVLIGNMDLFAHVADNDMIHILYKVYQSLKIKAE